MKKFSIGFIFLVFIAIGIYFSFKFKGTHTLNSETSSAPAKPTLRKLLSSPSSLSLKSPPEVKSNPIEPVCLDEWTRISEFDLLDVEIEKVRTLAADSKCKMFPDKIAKVAESFLKSCSQVSESNEIKNESLEKCVSDLFLYRATLSDWFTQDLDISKISDKKLLFEKLYSMLGREDIDPIQLDAVSRRFLELDPENTEIQRVSIMSTLMGLMAEVDSSKEKIKATDITEKWEKLSELHDRYLESSREQNLEKNYNDSKVLELGLFINSKSLEDLVALEKESKLFIEEHPNQKDIGFYYLAAAHWNSGRKEEALEALKEANKLNPNEKRYQTLLAKISDNKNAQQKGVFEFSFDANLELNLDQ